MCPSNLSKDIGSIDLHCDTISRLYRLGQSKRLAENDLQIDIARLRAAGAAAQFFAVFLDAARTERKLVEGLEMIDRFYRELEENAEHIAFAGCAEDLLKNAADGRLSAFLTLEDSSIIDGNPSLLRLMYRLGVRLVTLTWNHRNEVGSPNQSEEEFKEGLTPVGGDFVREMERLGMLVDVSHLSDAGFYDVARILRGPFVASHSNARVITEHPRNLTDDMTRVLAEHGGVIGINFFSLFAGPYRSDDLFAPRSDAASNIADVVRHIRHLTDIGGIDCIGLGSDFDGINAAPEGLEEISRLPALFDALGKAGYSDDAIDKIRYGNALRVIRDVLK